jgi:asparagine synthase (glutamine-hydrolysing)
MCGIYGIISNKGININDGIESLKKTQHRGPDNQGYWVDKKKRIFIGHNRLSIIDVSPISNQPMISKDTETVLTFNGEIYNYKIIRKELLNCGISFTTSSDTEVVIKSLAQWGVNALNKFKGMFSFCLYNIKEQTIILARDRVGEKPLFYSVEDGVFQFSSETRNLNLTDKKIDYYSLNYYLGAFGIPSGKSIYQNIKQLKPGHYLEIKTNKKINNNLLIEKEYWSLNQLEKKYVYDEKLLLDEFDYLLTESIKGQLQSDVPLGILLSGGIDSTIITAKVSELINNVNTFTVSFKNRSKYDESKTAKFISDRFGTKHTQLELSDININIFLEIIDSLDQPLADNSYIPVSLISRAISGKSIKVVIGGDGADEIFGGYRQYRDILKIMENYKTLPKKLLEYLIKLSKFFPSGFPNWNYCLEFESIINNEYALLGNSYNNELRKKLLNESSIFSDYSKSIKYQFKNNWDYIQNSCLVDFSNYLPNNILTKIDRASMQSSLETRAPFLDKDIIEFGFTKVPTKYKTSSTFNKILLQNHLKTIVPDYPNYNIKKGFVFPINEMMIKDRSWSKMFEETIFNLNQDLFNQTYLKKLWSLNKIGLDHSQRLYSIFVFNRWTQNNSIQL